MRVADLKTESLFLLGRLASLPLAGLFLLACMASHARGPRAALAAAPTVTSGQVDANPPGGGPPAPTWDFDVVNRWHLCEKNDLEDCSRQCQSGHLPSCVRLGDIYATGRQVPPDLVMAAALYELPCQLDISVACVRRGEVLSDRGDAAEAAQAFRRGCDLGEALACYKLGILYRDALIPGTNAASAAPLLQTACDEGEARACADLGSMLMKGDGVARDAARAAKLFQTACDGGNVAVGCGNLGSAYLIGAGVPKDPVRARDLHRRACAAGNGNFCALLEGARPTDLSSDSK